MLWWRSKERQEKASERYSERSDTGGRGNSSGMSFANSMVQETLYHGTNNPDISQFSTQGKESNGAIFFADDPDYAEEEAYVKHESNGGQETMYEVKLNIQNPSTVTLPSNKFGDPTTERKYIQQAKLDGKDSVIFKETGNSLGNQTFYAVFSPKQVKITKRRKI